MTRPSDDIERVVDSAAKALTALQDLAADLDTLKDSNPLFIIDQEKLMLRRHSVRVHRMTAVTDEIRRYLDIQHEAAAWLEEEEKAEQCNE